VVEVVKQHAGYERSVFESVAELRARGMRETRPAALARVEARAGAPVSRA
jgi:hypothetical protein